MFYETGQVVPQDFAEAFKWYQAAADQELPDAQCNLGLCYQTGRGVEQNSAPAVKWFVKAARQGNKTAQHNLGVHYAINEPEPDDEGASGDEGETAAPEAENPQA